MTAQAVGQSTARAAAQDAAQAGKPRPALLRGNRTFRLLWVGQALSDLGSGMTFVALPLVLLRAGYSPAAAGTIGTATLLTTMAVRIPAGYLTDRLPPRTIMLTCDLGRLALLGTLAAWTILGRLPLALAIAAVIGGQLGLELFRPSQNILLRRTIPAEQLVSAVAVNQARAYAADIVAPSIAGLLLELSLGAPFCVDALTFAASATCIALIADPAGRMSRPAPQSRTSESEPDSEPEPDPPVRFTTQLSAGVRYLVRDRLLRTISMYFALLNFVFQALVYVVLLGLGHGHDGPAMVGAAMSAASVTGMTGALFAPRLRKALGLSGVVALGPALSLGCFIVAAVTGSPVAVVAALCALCLMTPVIGAQVATLMAAQVPEEIYGRVTTASGFTAELGQPLGPLAAGVLLSLVSFDGIAAAFTAMLFALTILAVLLPRAATRPRD